MRKFVLALVGTACIAAPVSASHIYFSSVRINGVLLEDGSGFTNPTINVDVGELITVECDVSVVFGGPWTDTLYFDYTYVAGSLGAPPDASFPTGGASFETLGHTGFYAGPGSVSATLRVDIGSSFPDYVIPGTGVEVDSRTFPFTIDVKPPTGVIPLPSAAGMGLAGLGLVGLRRRR